MATLQIGPSGNTPTPPSSGGGCLWIILLAICALVVLLAAFVDTRLFFLALFPLFGAIAGVVVIQLAFGKGNTAKTSALSFKSIEDKLGVRFNYDGKRVLRPPPASPLFGFLPIDVFTIPADKSGVWTVPWAAKKGSDVGWATKTLEHVFHVFGKDYHVRLPLQILRFGFNIPNIAVCVALIDMSNEDINFAGNINPGAENLKVHFTATATPLADADHILLVSAGRQILTEMDTARAAMINARVQSGYQRALGNLKITSSAGITAATFATINAEAQATMSAELKRYGWTITQVLTTHIEDAVAEHVAEMQSLRDQAGVNPTIGYFGQILERIFGSRSSRK